MLKIKILDNSKCSSQLANSLNVAKETGLVIELQPSTIKVLDVKKDMMHHWQDQECSSLRDVLNIIWWHLFSACEGKNSKYKKITIFGGFGSLKLVVGEVLR